MRKRQDLTQEEFVQCHKNDHAPLFMSLPEVQQYVRKYVHGYTQPVTLPGLPPPAYDGTTVETLLPLMPQVLAVVPSVMPKQIVKIALQSVT